MLEIHNVDGLSSRNLNIIKKIVKKLKFYYMTQVEELIIL